MHWCHATIQSGCNEFKKFFRDQIYLSAMLNFNRIECPVSLFADRFGIFFLESHLTQITFFSIIMHAFFSISFRRCYERINNFDVVCLPVFVFLLVLYIILVFKNQTKQHLTFLLRILKIFFESFFKTSNKKLFKCLYVLFFGFIFYKSHNNLPNNVNVKIARTLKICAWNFILQARFTTKQLRELLRFITQILSSVSSGH